MAQDTLRTAGIEAARDYQDLPAWTRAMTVAEAVYAATEGFPEREIAGLAASMRANAVAVASHIATASARSEYGIVESYSKSQSALAELATQIELASRLGYVADTLTAQIDEVGRLLIGLKHGLKTEAKATARKEREDGAREQEFSERKREFKSRDREFAPRERAASSDRQTSREERQYKPRDSSGGRDSGERKPYGDKKPYGDRKPYGDKKPYEKKAYGDRPARSEGEDRPRREYKPRDGASSDRKPSGDRKPYGDKKPYGAKKPYGDRKPSGDRPYTARKPRD